MFQPFYAFYQVDIIKRKDLISIKQNGSKHISNHLSSNIQDLRIFNFACSLFQPFIQKSSWIFFLSTFSNTFLEQRKLHDQCTYRQFELILKPVKIKLKIILIHGLFAPASNFCNDTTCLEKKKQDIKLKEKKFIYHYSNTYLSYYLSPIYYYYKLYITI